jgi:hypothetical protein
MHRYEIASFTFPLGGPAKALPRIEAYMQGPKRGALRACFISEIGALNEVMVIRQFDDDAQRIAERERINVEGNPFGIGDLINGMTIESYTLFPFLPPMAAGSLGPFFEVRSYTLRPSGLAPTIAAWEAAVPGRASMSPLAAAMYALEGNAPRFTHIWPYKSLDERTQVRGAAVEQGIWPPKGGPDHILTMRNGIYLAAPFSPLR